MKKVIFAGGIYNLFFVCFHTGFWKIFNWNTELLKLDFTNGWIMQILNVQIIYYFIITAIICFAFHKELLTTKLGKWFLLGSTGFWFIRAIQQLVFWELGIISTIIGVLFFLLGSALFLIPAIRKPATDVTEL